MMNDMIRKKFDEVAQSYDQQRRQLIPCFDDFYGTAMMLVNLEKKAPKVLDLGAGTGLFASYVRQQYPEAELTLIDLSEEMINQARIRFGDDSKVEYIVADYTTYSFGEKRYDAVISSLSIHHLSHQAKKILFHSVYKLLLDTGIFVNADQAAGSSSYFDNRYKQQWEEAILRNGLPTQVVESAIERRKLDINATVADQLLWLREAGFVETDCIYKNNEFAVFFSQK
ncbi:class I SAM-dependent methyltransferase [Paenibacillus crassostreae]|nr:class I SAM-dependent methyltransferase [Paenibacillus crassostreae]